MSSLPASLMKIQSKMKALSCSQHFLHYKSMGKLFVAQGQVTPKQIVQSDPKSNSPEILCLSSLPASLKKIKSKNKALGSSQQFSHNKPVSRLMRLWHLSPSVNSIFKRACAAIQWSYTSYFWSDPSSTSIRYVCEQRRLWRDCVDAQSRLSLRCSPMR